MHKNIQIVDNQGALVGIAKSPFAAIEAGQIRLLARVIITDGKGKFLLQRRAKDMRMYPDCWDTSAAGHVDEGESASRAAARELEEETSLKVELTPILEYYDELYIKRYDMTFKSYSRVFTGVFTGDINSLALRADEVAAVRWATRQEIEDLIKNQPENCTDGLLKIFGEKLI